MLTERSAMRNAYRVTGASDLIPSKEVCQRLDIDRSTLMRWASPGHAGGPRITPAMRLPGERGAMLFYRADVDRLQKAVEAERADRSP
jgi:predicted site-specific integrase-resolvase